MALAVRRVLPDVARAVDAIVVSLARGGRLFYVGAGTGGRLAAQDAAECPPTFGISPKTVQAIVAGGDRALRHPAEEAEDSAPDGARDLKRAGVSRHDVVVGLSASGRTPYVLGALRAARRCGAITVGVASISNSPLARESRIAIAPDTGAEAISGSTRLKAGTAQKMALNMLSTAAMVRLGRTYGNWMVHVALTNRKLRQRAARILEEATGVNTSVATRTLRQARHDLPIAIVMLKAGTTTNQARQLLEESCGNVRRVLELAKSRRKAGSQQGK